MSRSNPDSLPLPRWQRRPDARPDEILDAAQAVFGNAGFARATLEEVARIAGVSKGTLYLYFDSKETLFREMVRARIVTAVAEGEALFREHQGSCRELLTLLMRRMWSVVRTPEMARIGRLVLSELPNFPEVAQFYFDEVILRSRRLVESVIERGIVSGEFRPSARRVAPRAICSMLVHSAQVQCFFSAYDPAALDEQQLLAGAIDLVLDGVATHPTDDPRP